MTFATTVQVLDEEVLTTLTSSKGLLIGYSIDEYPNIFPSHHKAIKFINDLPHDKRKELHDNEIIIHKHKICPKDTVYGENDYDGIKGEILETEEYLQFDKRNKQWR